MVEIPPQAGYRRLASLMGAHPETAIFRRFGQLNALNLLYLQAELSNLENALHKAAESDAESKDPERSIYDRDWQALKESVTVEAQKNGGNPTQWRLMLQIRDKLNEYNQTLYFQHMVAKIGPPNKHDHSFLQTWMKVPWMGNVYLLGADNDFWEKNFDPAELLCLLPRQGDSILTRFITNRVIIWYHHCIGHLFKTPAATESADTESTSNPQHGIYGNTVHYSQSRLVHLSNILGTVFAILLLVGSIVVLHYIAKMEIRLLMIALFSVVFSLGLYLFTNGGMAETFSASATFAAVQVVFVSGNGPTDGQA